MNDRCHKCFKPFEKGEKVLQIESYGPGESTTMEYLHWGCYEGREYLVTFDEVIHE